MTRRNSTRALAHLLMLVLALPVAHAAPPAAQALRGSVIYPAPDLMPIRNGVILVRGGKVAAVGPADEGTAATRPLARQCDGGVILAGFQNSHVHLIGSAFTNAHERPARVLEEGLTALFTRWGFTTVFDIASDRGNTLALRARVDRGELAGPLILTAGWPIFPPVGLPIYLDHLDPAFRDKLPQPDSVDSALATVRQNLNAGADATKLFLVTPQGGGQVKRMSADIAAAAVEETHRRGKLVFAHPTDLDGVRAALQARVDILAHPPLGVPAPWPKPLFDQLRAEGVSLIPTLKLLRYELAKEQVPREIAERIVNESVQEFGKFAAAGGDVLFGTDVDYMTDADPTAEYELMAQAGMSAMQILASLTTAPAARWNESGRRGRIAPGLDADLVVLEADPAQDVRRFAEVKCVVRDGRVIYVK
ncbi:MAG: amidohydrolase family protein [Piscinibacter sp.]|uniref:amidohydrolase family protein n=1 Tax=Piscinibacter sp. TaxID=1903157 RepID=UPI003D13EEC3